MTSTDSDFMDYFITQFIEDHPQASDAEVISAFEAAKADSAWDIPDSQPTTEARPPIRRSQPNDDVKTYTGADLVKMALDDLPVAPESPAQESQPTTEARPFIHRSRRQHPVTVAPETPAQAPQAEEQEQMVKEQADAKEKPQPFVDLSGRPLPPEVRQRVLEKMHQLAPALRPATYTKGCFSLHQNALFDDDALSAQDICVYLVLERRSDNDSMVSWPGTRRIAKEAHISINTLFTRTYRKNESILKTEGSLHRLIRLGYIYPLKGGTVRGTRNYYILLDRPEFHLGDENA